MNKYREEAINSFRKFIKDKKMHPLAEIDYLDQDKLYAEFATHFAQSKLEQAEKEKGEFWKFILWYSGMAEQKVRRAFERFKNENK